MERDSRKLIALLLMMVGLKPELQGRITILSTLPNRAKSQYRTRRKTSQRVLSGRYSSRQGF